MQRATRMTERLVSAVRVCILGVLLCAAPAMAQEVPGTPAPATPEPAKAVPAWTVTCTSTGAEVDLACTLSQVILVKESGQRVLTVTVGREAGKLMLRLSLPHGLDLLKGVDVWIDKGERKNHPIVTADQKGSYAVIPLDDAMVAALKMGTDLSVSVTAFAGSALVVNVSLAGFTAGFAKL